MNNTDILYASLLGSKVNIGRFGAVQNELMKHVLPPIPFLPFQHKEELAKGESVLDVNLWQADKPLSGDDQFFPIWFEVPDVNKGKRWLFPYEPLINISGRHTLIRRNVAKAHSTKSTEKKLTGSIKEHWNQDDYEITITGALIGAIEMGDSSQTFPRKDFEMLRDYIIKGKRIKVYCEPLQLLGINYLVISDFSFPFTKGENVQAYEIKAYSDFDYNLLLDIND